MEKMYIMIVENPKTGERKSFSSYRQGAHPEGWKTVGVSGFYEEPKKDKPKKEEVR